jgi:hypothetical protein
VAGQVQRLPGQAVTHQRGHLLVGAVLQQAGEEQVALFQQGLRLVGVGVGTGQQPRRLELQQGRGHHQELRGHLEVELPHALDLGQVVLGDARQRHLPDVEALARDEVEEQVERPLEDLGLDHVAHAAGDCSVGSGMARGRRPATPPTAGAVERDRTPGAAGPTAVGLGAQAANLHPRRQS